MKGHTQKWNQLETMLYDTPEKARAPHTAKASSRGTQGNTRTFKFVRANNNEYALPRSLNVVRNISTPDKMSSDGESFDNTKKTIDPHAVPGSFNSIDEDFDSHRGIKTVGSSHKKSKFTIPNTHETVIIRTRVNKVKNLTKMETASMNQLDKVYRVTEPVCGIDECHFQLLFRKKCEDMQINGALDTEDMFISNIRKKSQGVKLCFLESGFGKAAIEQLGTMLENSTQVSQLFLRKSVMSDSTTMNKFSQCLGRMPNLVHLDLANNGLEPKDFVTLFKNLSKSNTLTSIDLSNYEPDRKNRLGVEGVEAFKAFVENNIYLQFVTLSNLMLDDDLASTIITALEKCPNLAILNISSNTFSGRCLETLTNLFAKTALIRLDVSHNKLKKEAAQNLVKLILAQRPVESDQREPVEVKEGIELILENTNLGSEINLLLQSLGRGSNVKKFDFSSNVLSDVEVTQFEAALSENRKIQEFNLANCKLGEIGGKMLALGVKKNKSLLSLNLSNNNLDDSTGAQIVYSLIQNHMLNSLDLSQNKLAEQTAKALCDIIRNNKRLQRYNLTMNNFDEPEGYMFQEALLSNSNITLFNIAYTRVNYNSQEALATIVKDNVQRLQFATVPKLRNEVDRTKFYIDGEKHNLGKIDEFQKKKDEIKRDVKRFGDTLTDLKSREKSPNFKKKERLLLKLGKDIKEEQPKLDQINVDIREFRNAAQLEKEGFLKLLEGEKAEVEKAAFRLEIKAEEIEKTQQKYEPDIKILKFEMAKLQEEIRFMEMYNNTIADKIKKEKQIQTIQQSVTAPKVSDAFLASSELARFKKKNESPEKNNTPQLPAEDSPSETGQAQPKENKVEQQLDFVRKIRQDRADRLIHEIKTKDTKKLKRQVSKSDNSKQEMLKNKINAKIQNMMKEDKVRLEPISEAEIKDK